MLSVIWMEQFYNESFKSVELYFSRNYDVMDFGVSVVQITLVY